MCAVGVSLCVQALESCDEEASAKFSIIVLLFKSRRTFATTYP